jgi:hypothetical protein
MTRSVRAVRFFVILGLVGLIALPAAALHNRRPTAEPAVLSHLSQSVQARYYLANPDHAPSSLKPAAVGRTFKAAASTSAAQVAGAGGRDQPGIVRDLFNDDDVGFPQNEEAITVCKNRPRIVVEGTNDYRGLLDPAGNFTGWHFSTNGGRSIRNEGLLPPVTVGEGELPSGGDPVVQSDESCHIYAASLNYGLDPFNEGENAISVYRTTPERLRECPRGEDFNLTHPSCWPNRRAVATAGVIGGVGQFLDKEWMDVGQSGEAGNVVWVTYSDFALDINEPLGFTGAQIKAVRCSANLSECTEPILISGADPDVQFSDVTIAEDGSTLVTWVEIAGELEQTAQTFTVKMRLAPPGSTDFGPTQIVSEETNPIPFGGFLHANDFRVATYPKAIMPEVKGRNVIFIAWDRCRYRLLDNICEEAEIVLSRSNDEGESWSNPRTISAGGDNYFPAISDEVGNPKFVVAWFTNRFDRIFHNRQDVEMVTIKARGNDITKRQRVTPLSNESEADPLLGGFFIGDYIDVHLLRGTAYVAYNANYRSIRVLDEGFPIPQQDNYLTKVRP